MLEIGSLYRYKKQWEDQKTFTLWTYSAKYSEEYGALRHFPMEIKCNSILLFLGIEKNAAGTNDNFIFLHNNIKYRININIDESWFAKVLVNENA